MSKLDNLFDELYGKLTTNIDYNQRIPRDYIADWLKTQTNENDEPITVTDWLIDLIYLFADVTRHRAYLTGAAQIAKTLTSILVSKCLIEAYGKVRLVWVYATREQGDTYPDIQVLPILGGVRKARTVFIGKSVVYIRHANTSVETPSMVGKSLVKSGLSSLTADIAIGDEVSQWKTPIDPQDRVKRSVFTAQPLRFYGTPGSGKGIEAEITEYKAQHIPCTAICGGCSSNVRADLYDIVSHDIEKSGRPYNYRFKTCPVCGKSAANYTAWRFKDESNASSIAVWLHPFLHCTTPEQMRKQLSIIATRSLVDKSVTNIYQQLLGTINRYGNQSILPDDIKYSKLGANQHIKAIYYGLDQGRRELYLVELFELEEGLYVNYINNTTLTGAVAYINANRLPCSKLAVVDFLPDAEAANYLKNALDHPIVFAVEANSPTANYDYKLDTVYSNGMPYQVLKFQYRLWVEQLINTMRESNVYVNREQASELITRHLTAVRYIAEDMKVIRPNDKTDDLFFAFMFAMFARTLVSTAYSGMIVKDWSL